MRQIPLKNSDRVALVDNDDFERIAAHVWYFSAGYARRLVRDANGVRNVAMHREVLGADANHEVDHKDGDKLNNVRANLRMCTRAQNEAAKPPKHSRHRTSRFKGVDLLPKSGKWRARVCCGRREIRVGHFDSEIAAAKAYDEKAREIHGEFAWQNFPHGAVA